MSPEDRSTELLVAVDGDLSVSLFDSSSRSLDRGCGNASFLHVTLAFPDSVFPLAVVPAHPHHEEQTSRAIGMARWAQG